MGRSPSGYHGPRGSGKSQDEGRWLRDHDDVELEVVEPPVAGAN